MVLDLYESHATRAHALFLLRCDSHDHRFLCSLPFCLGNGDWQQHGNHTGGFYKCNRWDPKEAAKSSDKDSAEESRAELNRYLHYYQRYHNHEQSKRFAEKQKIQTEKRMSTLHAQSGGEAAWIDFQFLAAATQQVLEVTHTTNEQTMERNTQQRSSFSLSCISCLFLSLCPSLSSPPSFQCRNVLKYTYVLAYYLEAGPEKTLFEFLQQQLEASNEHLSELSELPPIEKIDRTQIVNYTRICKQFQENLLNGVASGLTPH